MNYEMNWKTMHRCTEINCNVLQCTPNGISTLASASLVSNKTWGMVNATLAYYKRKKIKPSTTLIDAFALFVTRAFQKCILMQNKNYNTAVAHLLLRFLQRAYRGLCLRTGSMFNTSWSSLSSSDATAPEVHL